MSQGVCLLDEALNLARQEMAALEDGAYDKAVELAERRGEVTSMAWHMLDDSQAEEYRAHLIELARVQDQLTELATKAHSDIRAQLQRSRLESRRMRGYHRAVGTSAAVMPVRFNDQGRRTRQAYAAPNCLRSSSNVGQANLPAPRAWPCAPLPLWRVCRAHPQARSPASNSVRRAAPLPQYCAA